MHATRWHIRPARPGDREFVLSLTSRLTEGFPLPPGRSPEEVVQAEARTLAAALEYPSADTALLIVERQDGDRGGMVYLQQQEDYFRQRPHAHVAILTVSAEVEGQGAGRALLDVRLDAQLQGLEAAAEQCREQMRKLRGAGGRRLAGSGGWSVR